MSLKLGRVTLKTPLTIDYDPRRNVEIFRDAAGVGNPGHAGIDAKAYRIEAVENGTGAQATMDALENESLRIGSVYVQDDDTLVPTGYYEFEGLPYKKPRGAPGMRPWSTRIIVQAYPFVTRQAEDDKVAGTDTADTGADEGKKIVYTPAAGTPAWNVATARYLQNKSVSAQDTGPTGVFFKPDGLKMYVLGDAQSRVFEYDLSTAWNVTTATYLQNKLVNGQFGDEGTPMGVFFKPDGLKMYVLGQDNFKVYEYDLSTAWNVTTATYLQNKVISAEYGSWRGLFFKPDGLKMYFTKLVFDGSTNATLHEWDLSTAWNVTTATYLQNKIIGVQDVFPHGVFFKPDGFKMYVTGNLNDGVYEYDVGSDVVLDPRMVATAEKINLPAGTYRISARVQTKTNVSQKFQLKTTKTAGTVIASGSQVTVGAGNNDKWIELDLGTFSIADADAGANWYTLHVQGVTGELGDVWIDRVRLVRQ